jgi:hypothetical protein
MFTLFKNVEDDLSNIQTQIQSNGYIDALRDL